MTDGILTTGKTKRIIRAGAGLVRLEAIDRLTGGDAARMAEIGDIGALKTRQAANVFTLLNRAGIPTAFVEQADDHTLICRECEMLPLEFVTRRYAFGSFLKRLSEDDRAAMAGASPYRFDELLWEVFHKEAVVTPPLVPEPVQMDEGAARDAYLRDGAWPDGVHTDSYIDVTSAPWGLYSAKAPVTGEPLMTRVPDMTAPDLAEAIGDIVLPTFRALEEAWAGVETAHGPVALVDMKVELGRDVETGRLLLADVIDNDSWRVWPGADPANQLDKQAFRDGAGLEEVSEKYALVAQLTERFLA